MNKIIYADVFESDCDYICITTNSILNTKGELIMGAGIAKRAKQIMPSLPIRFGHKILLKGKVGSEYNLVAHDKYIAFQTKIDWRDNSPLDLVERSIGKLATLANKIPHRTFALPFPAVNNGGLDRSVVMPLLSVLPNNVFIYDRWG